MNTNIIKYIIFCFLIISCKSKTHEIEGHYESYSPNKINHLITLLSYDGYVDGTSLHLKRDKTFELLNCSMEIKGIWEVKLDSLYLTTNSKKFIIDSLNYDPKWSKMLKFNNIPSVYNIKKQYLSKIYKTENGKIILEKLNKK